MVNNVMMNRRPLVAIAAMLLPLLGGCGGTDDTPLYPPDDITPPEGVVESTAPPRGPVDLVTAPGPLNEDGIEFLIHSYLPDHIGEAGSGGEVFCAHETYGWQQRTDTVTVWLMAYCKEFFQEAEEGTAFGTPVTIHLAELPAGWVVSFAEEAAGLGSAYEDSVREIFPPEVAKRALENGTSRDLSAEVEQAARNHGG